MPPPTLQYRRAPILSLIWSFIGDDSSRAGDSPKVPRIRHKLTEALSKKAVHTRVVFIDLNRAENLIDGTPPAWEQTLC